MTSALLKDAKYAAFFEYFGLVVFSYGLLKLASRFFNNFGTFFLGFGKVNVRKYGRWAIVTGCTDGIGKAYAEQLAKSGLNIVLISRTLSKLEQQSKELEDTYSVHTKVVAVDFTEQTSIYAEIKKVIADLDIGVLVNNVGMSYKHPDFAEAILADEKFTNDLINCNITSVTKMTGLVLPGMVSRKGGIIINVASASGRVPTPLLTVYSATKAYMDFFSRAIDQEYRSRGVIVQSVNPYFVSTKMSGMRKSLMSPKPDDYVKAALKTIGTQSVTNGYLWHNVQGWVVESVLPRWLVDHLTYKAMVGARAKGIKKARRLEEEQKKQ